MNDTLTGTNTLDDIVFALREVYVPLAKQKLYANQEKCCFGQSDVEYCDFIIGRNGIRPQPRKLMAVAVRVAAAAEFYGCEEFPGAMWVLSNVRSLLCHSGYTTD